MILSEQLQELISFAERGGYHWRQWAGVVFALMSGDPDFICSREGDQFVVRKSERGMLSGPMISAERLEDIEKYLSFLLGNTVRRKAGLSDIWLELVPVVLGAERDGFTFAGRLGHVEVSWRAADRVQRVSNLTPLHPERFVIYSRFSASEIRRSLLQDDGHPLFTSATK